MLDAPGPYVIRGVTVNPSFTNITVAAYRDLAGVGTYLTSVDPYGQTTVSWNGTTATGADVTLGNPPPPSFAQGPSRLIVWPTDGGVIAQWERIRGVDGKEVPEGYRLYASTSPNPGPDGGTSIVKTLRAGSSDIAVLSLTNGTPFYFAISAFTGTTESPLSPVVGPITPAPPTGGHSISGSVSFGFPSSGTLYVFAVGSGMSLRGQKIVNPQSPQSFAISGLPDGRYDIGAFFDRDDDGQVAANDPLTFRRQEGLPIVAVAGADVSNVSLSWPGPDGAAWVASQYRHDGFVDSQLHRSLGRRAEREARRQGGAHRRSGRRASHRHAPARRRRVPVGSKCRPSPAQRRRKLRLRSDLRGRQDVQFECGGHRRLDVAPDRTAAFRGRRRQRDTDLHLARAERHSADVLVPDERLASRGRRSFGGRDSPARTAPSSTTTMAVPLRPC